MIRKFIHIIFNPNSFLRIVLRFGFFSKRKNPVQYVYFRHGILKLAACQKTDESGLPQKDIFELFPNIQSVSIQTKLSKGHAFNVSAEELQIISAIVVYSKPQAIFEFGTFDGRTSYHMGLNAPSDCSIITNDIQKGSFQFDNSLYNETITIGGCFLNSDISNRFISITGDSKKIDVSQYFGKVDIVFVDGDHSFEGVLSDSDLAFKLIKKNGLILWHDYNFVDGVTRALNELNLKNYNITQIKNTTLAIYKG